MIKLVIIIVNRDNVYIIAKRRIISKCLQKYKTENNGRH